jgi:CRISPR-associated protein Cas2
MIVLVVSKAPRSLRGKLTRWLLQLKAGVYVGTLSARVRNRIWEATCESLRSGWAVMLFAAKTEQGFDIRAHGTSPVEFEDIEGLWLAKKLDSR